MSVSFPIKKKDYKDDLLILKWIEKGLFLLISISWLMILFPAFFTYSYLTFYVWAKYGLILIVFFLIQGFVWCDVYVTAFLYKLNKLNSCICICLLSSWIEQYLEM